ncbi:hypothetical protein IV203_015595 [Nitzschia inconspicua]|uniref:Uncharacterized protein n=1 Tax=Nitzschia inconspicua TaxID=303405 RepID=A0A9K3PTM1_9STRA|nr:hypothetical protein IV203_015595 [Nitzschia inconspicua]
MKLNVFTVLMSMYTTSVAGFAAPKKIKFTPYGEDHQANGNGGKGPLGKQWTSKCDTLAQEGVGPMGAQLAKPSEGSSGSKIKRSVDIMPDNTKKVSVLNDLLGYKK